MRKASSRYANDCMIERDLAAKNEKARATPKLTKEQLFSDATPLNNSITRVKDANEKMSKAKSIGDLI